MMTQPNHHLTDALIADYAAGRLPEAFAVVVAAHVSYCDACRAAVGAQEAFGAALMETAEPVAMSAGAMQAAMSRILAAPPLRVAAAPGGAVLPAPVRDIVGGDLGAVRWRPVGMGVKQAVLPTSGAGSVRLLSIPPGMAMPEHGHRGREITLVLQGAYADADGTYRAGDVEVAGDEVEHTPVAEPGETCICLAATDAPLRFRALIPRLVQPFLGI
ncbi:ChrR family anti-sigma-E factor [Frigidibacter sp. MR17.24]|uniref:ChrR family anti-sigma-E factor n=1 Tax=Frigidibacter sp. MR17.24 TaxID=3127345 RepID=UPI003012FA37